MPRANRYHLADLVWHITHRCHNRDYLLRFACDRKRWLDWMYDARQRCGPSVLTFCVTGNHVHIVAAEAVDGQIARTMQLVQGRTAQEYNQRKARCGAFWQDRYHATAIETDAHLRRCLCYVDLNMVRAGVVAHPRDWPFCGYQEIVGLRQRKCIVDRELLMRLLGLRSLNELAGFYAACIDEVLRTDAGRREAMWTENVAVGKPGFVDAMQSRLERTRGLWNMRRSEEEREQDTCMLRDDRASYGEMAYEAVFGDEKHH